VKKRPRKARVATRQRDYLVTVNAPRNLWVKSSDLEIELGLSENFRVELQDTLFLFGEARILRGRASVLGRQFEIQKDSVARFTGPPSQPSVAVTAIYNDQADGITVSVNIAGQGKDIKLTPSSEPPLSESEIYTLLATGRTTLKHGGASTSSSIGSAQAASVLGSLVASQLKKTLASNLPLDVLSIQAGDQTQGITGTLEAGRYFGRRLYVGYEGRLGADPTRYQNSNSVRLEYQFSPRWSAQAEYGDARQGQAELIWSRDY
jgi:translocation and assembly module TamB